MRIIEDVKLDFNDVLIKPKRSTLTTRKDANLTRRFTFRHSKNDWTGVPIIAANMDHTGTYEMHKALREYDMLTALCKFVEYTYQTPSDLIQTIGLDTNLDTIPESKWICLDVANGYTERFMEFVEKNTRSLKHKRFYTYCRKCMHTRSNGTDNTRWGGHCEDWHWNTWERVYYKKDDWRGVSTTEPQP